LKAVEHLVRQDFKKKKSAIPEQNIPVVVILPTSSQHLENPVDPTAPPDLSRKIDIDTFFYIATDGCPQLS